MSAVGQSAGSKIILEVKNNSPNQKWLRSQGDQEGWFSLKNPLSGLFLNNDIISVDINIQGNFMPNLQLFIKLHNICHTNLKFVLIIQILVRFNRYMLDSSGKDRYVPMRHSFETTTCAVKDEASSIDYQYYLVKWAALCNGIIECSDGIDELGCESPFWLLPIISLGSGVLMCILLVCYLHFKLKKRIGEMIELFGQEDNCEETVSASRKKWIYIAILTEQEDIIKIQDLVSKEIELHGSHGKAICYLKVCTKNMTFKTENHLCFLILSQHIFTTSRICWIPKHLLDFKNCWSLHLNLQK